MKKNSSSYLVSFLLALTVLLQSGVPTSIVLNDQWSFLSGLVVDVEFENENESEKESEKEVDEEKEKITSQELRSGLHFNTHFFATTHFSNGRCLYNGKIHLPPPEYIQA